MKVKCIYNSGKLLPQDLLNKQTTFKVDTEFALKLEKEYLVYAMECFYGYIWYYICDERHDSTDKCPFWNPYPSVLFELIDGRLSTFWRYNSYVDKESKCTEYIFALPEWAKNSVKFYYRFIEGESPEIDIFKKYKVLMDLEFPDDMITEKATILDNEWLMCPVCIDAWQSKSVAGMVECPKCKNAFHNPRYKEGN